MNQLWRSWFIFIVLVIIIPHACAIRHHDLINDENESLPSDFVDFVKSLDKMVFNKDHKKNKTETDATTKHKRRSHATKNVKFRRSNNNLKSSQNSALRDILMLKLVSYYEDKYKVSQDDYTTHRALEPLFNVPAELPAADHAAEHAAEQAADHAEHAAEPPDEVRSVGSPLLAADESDKHLRYGNRRKIWYPDTTKYHENTDDNTLDQITPEAKQTFADVVVL